MHVRISGDAYSKRRQHAPHLRKQHVDNEVGHTARQSVKLIAAIVAHRRAIAVLHHARVDKHNHDWRHCPIRHKTVEHRLRGKHIAVETQEQRRLTAATLRGIDRDTAFRPGKHRRIQDSVGQQSACSKAVGA